MEDRTIRHKAQNSGEPNERFLDRGGRVNASAAFWYSPLGRDSGGGVITPRGVLGQTMGVFGSAGSENDTLLRRTPGAALMKPPPLLPHSRRPA